MRNILDYIEKVKQENEGPRITVAELTNMNTPDLEQSPDSFLRPGETLEDWDVTFRRPNAQGGRIPFEKAGSVKAYPDRIKTLAVPKGYVTAKQLAEELGIAKETLKKYRLKNLPVDKYPLKGFIDETFKPIRGAGNYTYYLKPTEKMLDNYSTFKNKVTISRDLLKDVETLHNSDLMKKLRKSKKKTLPTLEEVVKVLGKDVKAHGRAANAMATLSKMYKGEEYKLLKLPKNEKLGEFMFKALRQGGKHNPYKQAFYQLAIGEIDKTLGNEVGTLKNFKRYFKDNLTKYLGKNHGVSLNEVASISGMVRNDMAAYGAFVDLTKTKINEGLLANFQGTLSDTLNDIDKLKGSEKKLAIKNFNESTLPKAKKKIAANYGDEIAESIRFTEIVPGTKLTDTYTAKDIATWKKKHSIDLKALAKQKGYYLDVKGARPFTEFIEEGKINKKGVTKFLTTFSDSFDALSPRSIAQLSKEFGCGKKSGGGSIMSCLKTNFNKAPEKFLQRSAPLAKNNTNLFNWFKNGRKIARGTGIALAWEAAFAPIIGGWGKLEGLSNQRILNEIAYGIPFIGETEKEEFMREAGGDEKAELAYKMQRMGELEEQELPNLYQQRADVINKMANVEGKSFHQRTIEDDIKEKELELQGLINTPDFYEGPVGSYYNQPVIQGAFDLEQQTREKIAADTAKRKKDAFDALRTAGIIADRNWQSQVSYAGGGRAGYMGGGITGIRKPHAIPPERQGLRSIMINGKKS